MSTIAAGTQELGLRTGTPLPEAPPVVLTEKASKEVTNIVAGQRLKCLTDLAPEYVESFNALNAQNGRSPTLAQLSAKLGVSEKDLLTKLGQAAVSKVDYLTPELRDTYRELFAAKGQAPTAAELAEKAGITEPELIQKLGASAAVILGTVYLRLRVVGGGCSGFQNKLDLDPVANPKLDDTFELHNVPIVIDRRSLMYLNGVTVDFHDEINRRGFSIQNPNAKTTCGCGSSYSM